MGFEPVVVSTARARTRRRQGGHRAAVARSRSPHVGVPGTERWPLPNALGDKQRGGAIFDADTLLHRELPLPVQPLRVFLLYGRHVDDLAGAGIAGEFCDQDAQAPNCVQPIGFGAPGAAGHPYAGRLSRTWLMTPCVERSRCNQNPPAPASKQDRFGGARAWRAIRRHRNAHHGGVKRWAVRRNVRSMSEPLLRRKARWPCGSRTGLTSNDSFPRGELQ